MNISGTTGKKSTSKAEIQQCPTAAVSQEELRVCEARRSQVGAAGPHAHTDGGCCQG